MSVKAHAPKFVMPSIYRPKNERAYRCKVGYVLDSKSKRVRKEFRLGDDEVAAHKKALLLAEKGLGEEKRHYAMKVSFADAFGCGEPALPVWTGMPEREIAAREEYLSTPPADDDPETPSSAGYAATAVSLAEAREQFLGRLQGKAGKDAKAWSTYWWYERALKLGLVPSAIEPSTGRTTRTVHKAPD